METLIPEEPQADKQDVDEGLPATAGEVGGPFTRMGTFVVHPVAEAFPLIQGTDFEKLCDDVKRQGILNPIALLDGKVLDGRNRLRAALAVGVDHIPTKVLPAGTDPAAYVMSQNIARRHLSASQRATITVKLLEATGELARMEEAARESQVGQLRQGDEVPSPSGDGDGTGRVSEKLAELADVSPATVERVLRSKKADPEGFEKRAHAAMTGAKEPKAIRTPSETAPAAPVEQATNRNKSIEVPAGDAGAAARILARHYSLDDLASKWPKGGPAPANTRPSARASARTPKKSDGGGAVRWSLRRNRRGRIPGWVVEDTGEKTRTALIGRFGGSATFTKGGELPPVVSVPRE